MLGALAELHRSRVTVLDLSAARIAELVRAGELGRREVVEAHIERIEERNGELNALVDLRLEEALAEADAGGGGGPLDGVPISVKHNFDVEGMPTTLGIRSRAGLIAARDEPAVRRLRDAGAIVLGKANMPDLAIRWNTLSSLHGPTRNPRDPDRSAGGSSGGDAAAVGAGMAALGLGSDYGGSIRVPASWCGVPGFRPTTGLVAARAGLAAARLPALVRPDGLERGRRPLGRRPGARLRRAPWRVAAGPRKRAGRARGGRGAGARGGAARGDRRRDRPGGRAGGAGGGRARCAMRATRSRRAWRPTCAGRRSCGPRSSAPS